MSTNLKFKFYRIQKSLIKEHSFKIYYKKRGIK
ncbi:hypothetical protein P148_SR1C00001G0931 [candidate division SR1 bacterium RAAC1_SR1_1]|nr:hypothetical protein P148_SR1C00001G0931 [candidate division SR1 bacterium RAAC1_SR1_1]